MAQTAALEVIRDRDRAASMLHPLRLRVLEELGREPGSASGLSRRTGISRQKLNYHLRQLEEEGFVRLVEERKQRNCLERIYQSTARSYVLDPGALGKVGSDPSQISDRASSAYLVAVASEVIREVAMLGARAEASGRRVPTLTLQTDVRFKSAEDQQAFAHELSEQIARLVTKYHDEEASRGRRFRLVAASYPSVKQAG